MSRYRYVGENLIKVLAVLLGVVKMSFFYMFTADNTNVRALF